MKFYQKEKSKLGSAPGTIIKWAKTIGSNDPNQAANIAVLPAGYIRCDGSVYLAEQYPQLALLLGTGSSCLYKKADQFLSDDQFQVPDLGSKHIEASTSGNVGVTKNTEVEGTADDITIEKAGIGVVINSNIGTTAQVGFNGLFTLESVNFQLNGNVGWTIPTRTEEEYVSVNAIGSHMHRANSNRVTIREDHNYGATVSRPYYRRAADAARGNGNTGFGDCKSGEDTVGGKHFESVDPGGGEFNGEGNCNNSCRDWGQNWLGCLNGYTQSEGENSASSSVLFCSTWPEDLLLSGASAKYDQQNAASGSKQRLSFEQSMTAESWPNYASDVAVGSHHPYAGGGGDIHPICKNVEQITEAPPGSETLDRTEHDHRIDRQIEDTEYACTTREATWRPDGLTASANLRTSSTTKFDDIVSPYTVVEFLIKF